MNKLDTLAAAKEAIADRGESYGDVASNFQNIADLWAVILRDKLAAHAILTPADVALMMDAVKTARLIHTPSHADSWIDKAGYSAIGAEVSRANERLAESKFTIDQIRYFKSKICGCEYCESSRAELGIK